MSEMLEGNVLAAARLIGGIENELSGAVEELESLYLHTGRAYIVGVASAPQGGKGKARLLRT